MPHPDDGDDQLPTWTPALVGGLVVLAISLSAIVVMLILAYAPGSLSCS